MRNINEHNLTDIVTQHIKADTPRTQEVFEKLIKHLHAFVRDLEPTEAEWLQAIEFLTATGKMCSDTRQEFILLSDVTGVSMLVDAINHRHTQGVTETTVKGPFHAQANHYPMGANIAQGQEASRGQPTIVRGKIVNQQNEPIANAVIDVWQADDVGYYDLQDQKMPDANLRGVFTTDHTGTFWFKTIKPASYPIPDDGPVGNMLRQTGRHPNRPAHIHFWVQAEGYRQLITHLFVNDDQYLDSDVVFGVKESLILDFNLNQNQADAEKWGVTAPFYDVVHDFTLAGQ